MDEINEYRIADKDYFEKSEMYRGLDLCDTRDLLIGPNGFECMLGEPEDRCWSRDGSDVVKELNRLYSAMQSAREQLDLHINILKQVQRERDTLKAEAARMREAIRDIRDSMLEPGEDTIVTSPYADKLNELLTQPAAPEKAGTCFLSPEKEFVLAKYPKATPCSTEDGNICIMNWGGPWLGEAYEEEDAWKHAAGRLGYTSKPIAEGGEG